jgi:hypothetical protein
MHLPAVKNDSVRLSIRIVGSVFVVAVAQVFILSWYERANLVLLELVNNTDGAFVMLGIAFAAQSIPTFLACSLLWRIGRTWLLGRALRARRG